MSETITPPALDALLAAIPDVPHTTEPAALAEHAVDGCVPRAVVEPATHEQARQAMRAASASRLAVIPFGGGTHMALGRPPRAYDVALSLRRLYRIVAHEPADMTVTVEAGVRLADLQQALAAHGQHLPLDPPGPETMTVGGMLSANASGPLRHAFGGARDWLLGTRVVHADGGESKSGGRVVKNVTGYDVHKLYAGSLGTLGIVTEATFKLAPLPRARRDVVVRVAAAAQACALILLARDAGLSLHAAEALSPQAAQQVIGNEAWCMLARVAGDGGGVERSQRELAQAAREAGGQIIEAPPQAWDTWSKTMQPARLSVRVNVLPASVAAVLDALSAATLSGAMSATVAAGIVRLQVDEPDAGSAVSLVEQARRTAAQHGGFAVVECAPPEVRRRVDPFGAPRGDFEIMRRLKQQFDPDGVLSPGRFLGGL